MSGRIFPRFEVMKATLFTALLSFLRTDARSFRFCRWDPGEGTDRSVSSVSDIKIMFIDSRMKMMFKKILTWVCCTMLCVACSDKDDGAIDPSISIQKKSVSLAQDSGAQETVTFTATADWTVAVKDAETSAWCSVSPKQGTAGEASIVIAANSANETYDNRTAEVVISVGTAVSETITVTQKKKDALILSDNYYEASSEGEVIEVELRSNVSYGVVIPEKDRSWISQTSSKGLTDDVLRFEVKANNGYAERSTTITIKDADSALSDEITVSQAPVPALEVPATLNIAEGVSEVPLTIASTAVWTATPSEDNPDGCAIAPQRGDAGITEVVLTVTENRGTEPRMWEFVFRADTMVRTMKVSEGVLTVFPTDIKVSPAGETIEVTVQKNVDYQIEYLPESASEWIERIDSKSVETETVRFEVAPNMTGTASRSADIYFRGTDGDFSEKVTVRQSSVVPTFTDGWDIYSGGVYRYGPSIIINDDNSIDAWFASPGGTYGNSVDLYTSGSNTPVSLGGGVSVGQKFTSDKPFYAVGAICVNWSGNECGLRLSLYKWNGSYSATVTTQAVASQTFVDYADGGFVKVESSKDSYFPAGTYLWVMDQGATQYSGLWSYPGTVSGVTSYRNGVEVNSSYSGKVLLEYSEGTTFWDQASYWHSTDGGRTWDPEKMVLLPTEFSSDHFSVCDPGVAYWGGYYYIGYTSTENPDMVENHVYVARGKTPEGPWEKWNGSGWTTGTDVQPMIRYTDDPTQFGAGEPSIVVLDDTVYFYYSWNNQNGVTTRVATADVDDPLWPAHLTLHGVAMDKRNISAADHSDVKYREDIRKFQAIHTASRLGPNSYMVLWQSDDGITFTKVAEIRDGLQTYLHNCGWSGDAQGHIKPGVQQYVSYAYGSATAAWGQWNTRWSKVDF